MKKPYLIYVLVAVIPMGLFVLVQIPLVWQWYAITQLQQDKNRIREEVLRLQWLTADIENGFRGYVLTNQATFLARTFLHGVLRRPWSTQSRLGGYRTPPRQEPAKSL